jgi:hypothetical protein
MTEQYVMSSLGNAYCLPVAAPSEEVIAGLVEFLTALYHRAVLPPKSNIGTLDTTSVFLHP